MRTALSYLTVLLFLFHAGPAAAGEAVVHDLTVSGAKQRLIYLAPSRPRATLVMLPGGDGVLDIGNDGRPEKGGNFLVRTRALWLARGYALVIPDALDGESLLGERSTPDYVQVITALVAFARSQNPAPIFLVGTSQGSTCSDEWRRASAGWSHRRHRAD